MTTQNWGVGMYVCMYVCQKLALAVLPMERGNRLGQGERSLSGPIFLTPQAKLARGTPPTAYYRQSAGSAANFVLGLLGLPRNHKDQLGIPRPSRHLPLDCRSNFTAHSSIFEYTMKLAADWKYGYMYSLSLINISNCLTCFYNFFSNSNILKWFYVITGNLLL